MKVPAAPSQPPVYPGSRVSSGGHTLPPTSPSPRASMMDSFQGLRGFGVWFLEGAGTHLASTAVHDVLRGVIHLRFHVNILVFLLIHLDPQNSKGRPTKIQGNEISLFCLGRQQVWHQIQVLQEGSTLCHFSAGSGHRPPPTTHMALPARKQESCQPYLTTALPVWNTHTCSQPSTLRPTPQVVLLSHS